MRKKKEEGKLKTAGKYGLAAGAGIGLSKLNKKYDGTGIAKRFVTNTARDIGQSNTGQYVKNNTILGAVGKDVKNQVNSGLTSARNLKKSTTVKARRVGARALKGLRKSKLGRNIASKARTGIRAIKPYSGLAKAGLGGMAAYGAYRLLKKKKQED